MSDEKRDQSKKSESEKPRLTVKTGVRGGAQQDVVTSPMLGGWEKEENEGDVGV